MSYYIYKARAIEEVATVDLKSKSVKVKFLPATKAFIWARVGGFLLDSATPPETTSSWFPLGFPLGLPRRGRR